MNDKTPIPSPATILTADHYYATAEAVTKAIAESIAQDGRPVGLECLSASTWEDVRARLYEACEDHVVGGDREQYTGATLDGDVWRVVVEASDQVRQEARAEYEPTTWIATRLCALRDQSAAAWDRAIAACGDDAEDLRAARDTCMIDWDAAIEAVDLPSCYDIDYDVAVARRRIAGALDTAEDWRLDAQAERDARDALRCQCGDATGQPCAGAQGGKVVWWVPEHLRGTCRAPGDDGIPHAAMRLSVSEQCVDDLLELGGEWAIEEDVADADVEGEAAAE